MVVQVTVAPGRGTSGLIAFQHVAKALEVGANEEEVAEALAVSVAEALSIVLVIGSGVQVVWHNEGVEEHLRAHAHG